MTPPEPVDAIPRPSEALAEATRLNEELTALLSITDCAFSTLDLPELLDAFLARLLDVMHADAGSILLASNGELSPRATRGLPPGGVPRAGMSASAAAERFGADGAPQLLATVDQAWPEVRDFFRDQGVVSIAVVPLRARGQFVGVIHVDWRRARSESPTELHLLQIASDRCAAAILNARLYGELQAARAEADRTAGRLTLALEAADLGVWDWDIPAGKVFWDETHDRLFGVPSGTVAGTYESFERFVHPDDRGRMRKAVGHALGGEPFVSELRIVRPDGEIRWVSARGHLQLGTDGSPLRLLGVTQDVTDERSRAEERELLLIRERGARRNAENAERQIVNILERVTDSFVALDNSWRYTYVSRKAAEIFGRRPEDLVGKHIWTEFPEGIGQPFQLAYERAARQQVPVFLEEYYPPYQKWFENRIYPSADGLSIFFSDITEKKRTEEKLGATNRQLRALTARLAGAREEEAARIAREIHDEMGQLLTALKLEVGGMRTRLGRLEGDDAKDLQARAEDIAMLADELQGSVHRISEELRPAALDQLGLQAALASHLFSIRQRFGITASLEGALGERRLPAAVETGVFRIVQELLTNVVRHAGASKVSVALRLDGDQLTVRVSDDGRGIRPEEESRSLGLLGIRERVLLLKGTFGIEGSAKGTEAVVTIPTEVTEMGTV